MEQNFHAIQQRVRRYWFKDGIGEMMVGGLFLLLALYFAGHRWLPPNTNAPMYLDGSLVVILIVAAVVSPTGDIPNMMLFATPMMGLYVISIFIAWFFGKKRQSDAEAAAIG